MSSSSENISETSATKNTSENESVSCEKENKVTNETIVAREQELKGFIETLKCLLHEFQTECTGDQELLQLVEDQEKVFQNIATVESRAAVVLQGARGSKDEVFSQGLQVLGQGEWQKFFEEGKLGTTQSYGYEELKSIATSKDLDDELSALSNKFLPIWESNISLLPCTYAKMLLNLRKKRKLFQKRMITCISIIGRLSKPSQTNQAASVKLDELKIKLKKLQLDWSRHQKNELENLEQYRKRKMKEKEKEEQRMKKELEKQEKNAEKEKQKMERWYRLQERDEKKRATQEQKERKRMDTEAEQQAIHRQAAVLEKFIRSVPKLPLFQGINRRLVSASDDLQQMTRGNSGQEDNENVRDLLLSIRRTRKQAWNKLGIKYVSFGQGQSNRVKLLQFEGSCRPPFHGVVQKPLKLPNGRNPYIRLSWLDYDYDSEMEWVESEPGENISESASDDDDSLMDTECSSSSDDDSFLIDDENMSQNHYGSGPEGCFPIEELVGIVFSHESNDAERDVLSKFPRKQISHVKIVNCKGTSSKTYLDYLNNTEIILDDRPDQVPEMKDNWKTLEEFWQVQEKNTDNLSKIPSSPSASVNIKYNSFSSFGCLQIDILQEFHQYLLALLQSTSSLNSNLAYVRSRFLFLFYPLTSLSVIHHMHLETPSMMVKTCLMYHTRQDWLAFMVSCLLSIMQTLQNNLESIHIGKLEKLESTAELVEEFLSSQTCTVVLRNAFETLKYKIGNVITK